MLPRVFAIVNQAVQEAQVTLKQITSIGISTPGPVNNRTGIVYEPPNLPGWKHLPLRDLFQERYALPAHVENDANAAALGEYLHGAGQGCQHMIYMTVSTGIGGGVIIDGKIVEGTIGTAGELGHMSIDRHGPLCNCGNRGCLEYFASGTAIARKANVAIEVGQGAELLAFASAMFDHPSNVPDRFALPAPQDLNTRPLEQADLPGTTGMSSEDEASETLRVNAQTVARAAEAGIPLARSIIAEAAEALGAGLVNLLHIFNPDMIILGGGVALRLGDMLMEPMLRIVQERAMAAPRNSARITLAQLGDNAGLIGAGALTHYYEQLHDH
jgi:glucokinase